MNVRWKKSAPSPAYRKPPARKRLLASRALPKRARPSKASQSKTLWSHVLLRDNLPQVVEHHAATLGSKHLEGAVTLLASSPELATSALSTGGRRMTFAQSLSHEPYTSHETAVSQWPLLKDQGKVRTVSVMGMTFEVAFVSKKDFPKHAAIDAAGFYWGSGFIAVIEDLKESPEVSAAELERFNKYMAVHELGEMIFAAEPNPHEMATRLELAVAKSEGHLEEYLNFLKQHNFTKYRDIAHHSDQDSAPTQEAGESLQTPLQTISEQTVKTAYALANQFEWPEEIQKETYAFVYDTPEYNTGLLSHIYAASDQLIRGYHKAAAAVKDHLSNQTLDTPPSAQQSLEAQALFLKNLADVHQTFERSYFSWKVVPPFVLEHVFPQSLQDHLTQEITELYLAPFMSIESRQLVKIAGWIIEEADIEPFDSEAEALEKIIKLLQDVEDTLEHHDGPWQEAAIIHFKGETPLAWHMKTDPTCYDMQAHNNIKDQYAQGDPEGFKALGKGLLLQIFTEQFTGSYEIDIDAVIDSDLNSSFQKVWDSLYEQNKTPSTACPLTAKEFRSHLDSTPVTHGSQDHYGNAYPEYLSWVNQNFQSKPELVQTLIDWMMSHYSLSLHENHNLVLEDIDVFLSAGWIGKDLAQAVIQRILTEDHLKAIGILPSSFVASRIALEDEAVFTLKTFTMLHGENLLRVFKTKFCYQMAREIMQNIMNLNYPDSPNDYLEELKALNDDTQAQTLTTHYQALQAIQLATAQELLTFYQAAQPTTQVEAQETVIHFLVRSMTSIVNQTIQSYSIIHSQSADEILELYDALLEELKDQIQQACEPIEDPLLQACLTSDEWKSFSFKSFQDVIPEGGYNSFAQKLKTQLENAEKLLHYYAGSQLSTPHFEPRPEVYAPLSLIGSESLNRAWTFKMLLTEIRSIDHKFTFSPTIASRPSVQSSVKDKSGNRPLYQWERLDVRLRRLVASQDSYKADIYLHILFCETDFDTALPTLSTLLGKRPRYNNLRTDRLAERFEMVLKRLAQRFHTPEQRTALNDLIQNNTTLIPSEKMRIKALLTGHEDHS